MKTATLVQLIKEYNDAYRRGEPLVSDEEYDLLVEELKTKDPQNKLLKKAIIEEIESSDRMERLPIPMYSLEKFKKIDELIEFMKNTWKITSTTEIIITPKYDGISLCCEEKTGAAWTRGDGVEGQRSDGHKKLMVEKIVDSEKMPFHYTFGEAIFSKESFLRNKGDYKSARNCVAGLFNSPTPSPLLRNVSYIRYGLDDETMDKSDQFVYLEHHFKKVANWCLLAGANFLNPQEKVRELLDRMFEKMSQEYKCDGLVIELNDAKVRKELGRLPNMNPRYSVAYKNPEWSERADTKVVDIEWKISKDKKAKPVIIVDPIDLCGATVCRATGHNAKYICDNNICKGAMVTIARSGDVIPKHLKTIKYNSESFKIMCDDMMVCPACGKQLKWDETFTELICTNEACYASKIAELVFFFSVLGTEEFREPTITKFYEAGYTTKRSILSLSKEEMIQIEGIGISLAEKLSSQFDGYKTKGVGFAKLLTANNVFNGVMAEKTCQMILDNMSDTALNCVKDLEPVPIEHLLCIKGVAEKTARVFNKGIEVFRDLEPDSINIAYFRSLVKIIPADQQMNVCFTGFRDKELEQRLINLGHKVASGVSGNTTHLVVKDLSGTSSKMQKAQELKIPIFTKDGFEGLLDNLK